MNQACVSLEEVFAAAGARAASLVPETSGYLALAVADATSRLPYQHDDRAVLLTVDGSVMVPRKGAVAPPPEAARGLRDLLERLLATSTGSMPGLVSAARPRTKEQDVERVVTDIEAALIPVNRAAAKRALARLARETLRAKELGKLRKKPSQAPAATSAATPQATTSPTRPLPRTTPQVAAPPAAPPLTHTHPPRLETAAATRRAEPPAKLEPSMVLHEARAASHEAPAASHEAPAASQEAPAASWEAPAASRGAPAATWEASLAPWEAPAQARSEAPSPERMFDFSGIEPEFSDAGIAPSRREIPPPALVVAPPVLLEAPALVVAPPARFEVPAPPPVPASLEIPPPALVVAPAPMEAAPFVPTPTPFEVDVAFEPAEEAAAASDEDVEREVNEPDATIADPLAMAVIEATYREAHPTPEPAAEVQERAAEMQERAADTGEDALTRPWRPVIAREELVHTPTASVLSTVLLSELGGSRADELLDAFHPEDHGDVALAAAATSLRAFTEVDPSPFAAARVPARATPTFLRRPAPASRGAASHDDDVEIDRMDGSPLPPPRVAESARTRWPLALFAVGVLVLFAAWLYRPTLARDFFGLRKLMSPEATPQQEAPSHDVAPDGAPPAADAPPGPALPTRARDTRASGVGDGQHRRRD